METRMKIRLFLIPTLLFLSSSAFAAEIGTCEVKVFNLFGRVAAHQYPAVSAETCSAKNIATFDSNLGTDAKTQFKFFNSQVVVRGNWYRKAELKVAQIKAKGTEGETARSVGQCQITYLHPIAGILQKVTQMTTLQKCAASVSNNLAANHGKLHEAQLNFYGEKSTFEASFSADLPFDQNSINSNDPRNVSY